MPSEKALRFGRADARTAGIVWGSLERWFGQRLVRTLKTRGEIYVSSNRWAEIYLVPPVQVELVELLAASTGLHPYSAGLFLGYLERGEYKPSLPLAHLVARYAERGLVTVSEKAASLFLYGRDLFSGSITGYRGPLERGSLVVVLNPRGEALGYGVVVAAPHEWSPGSVVAVKNVRDLGWYLRRGG